MKKVLFTVLTAIMALPLTSQESASLLDELLGVQPVEMKIEGSEETLAEYQQTLDKEKAKLDEDLVKMDEDYKKEVSKMIEDFNKVLEKTIEQEVKNEKNKLINTARTMSMTLKKNKKDVLQGFNNLMTKEIRTLPKGAEGKKPMEIADLTTEYTAKFESEYKANLAVLDQFKAIEHLTKSAETVETNN